LLLKHSIIEFIFQSFDHCWQPMTDHAVILSTHHPWVNSYKNYRFGIVP